MAVLETKSYTIESALSPVDIVIALLKEIPCVEVFPALICKPVITKPDTWYISKSIFPEYPPSCDGTQNPPAHHNDIVVCQTSGKADNPKWLIDYPGITILVRAIGARYPFAYEICRCINDVLLGRAGTFYGRDRIEYVYGYNPVMEGGTHIEDPANPGNYIIAPEGIDIATHARFITSEPLLDSIGRIVLEGFPRNENIPEDIPDSRNVPSNPFNRDQLVSITQQGQIIDLGRESRDTVKRCNFSLNYDLIVQPAQTPLSCREPLL